MIEIIKSIGTQWVGYSLLPD